jgi:hypothetical protein
VAEPHIFREGRSPLSLLVQVSGVGAYLLLGSEEPTTPTSLSSLFLLIIQESPLPLFFFSLSRTAMVTALQPEKYMADTNIAATLTTWEHQPIWLVIAYFPNYLENAKATIKALKGIMRNTQKQKSHSNRGLQLHKNPIIIRHRRCPPPHQYQECKCNGHPRDPRCIRIQEPMGPWRQ